MTCQNCDRLVEAGLLRESPGARYELTALGRANYVDEIRNIDGLPAQIQARMEAAKHTPPTPAETSMPGFCFADKVVVHQIVAALAPTEVFRQRLLSVKYVAEAVNPSPFVFDPKFKLLHLPVPRTDAKAPGAPALYAPIIATYSKSLLSPASPWSESSMRYGPWVNQ